jgi:hypothetical protein
MLNTILLKLKEKLSKKYGLDCSFRDYVEARKNLEIEYLMNEGHTILDILNYIGLPELIIRFNEEKIKDITQRYCTKQEEQFLFINLLKNYHIAYVHSQKQERVIIYEVTNAFILPGFSFNENDTKLYWELLMRINPEKYSSAYLKYLFGKKRALRLISAAINRMGVNVLELEFGDLKVFETIIYSSVNEIIKEIETL